MKKTLRQLMI